MVGATLRWGSRYSIGVTYMRGGAREAWIDSPPVAGTNASSTNCAWCDARLSSTARTSRGALASIERPAHDGHSASSWA